MILKRDKAPLLIDLTKNSIIVTYYRTENDAK